MSLPRRRLVRPAAVSQPAPPQRQRQIQKLRCRLEAEQTALARWMRRLRRAFHVVEKQLRRVAQLERRIARLEE